MKIRLLGAALVVLGFTAVVTPTIASAAPPSAVSGTYYKDCDAARAAGVTPLHRGDDGYAPHLDRDNDGIACE